MPEPKRGRQTAAGAVAPPKPTTPPPPPPAPRETCACGDRALLLAELERLRALEQPAAGPAATADEVWTWLAACLDCGEPHEHRPEVRCPECPNCEHRSGAWTWGSPVDGHAYRSRFGGAEVARLRREWEEARRG